MICSCVGGGRFLVVGVWLVAFVVVCLLVYLSLWFGLGWLILVVSVGDLFGFLVCLCACSFLVILILFGRCMVLLVGDFGFWVVSGVWVC